jgi:hypothetical protein
MRRNFVPDSKLNEESNFKLEKHFADRTSSDDAREIDFSDERKENVPFPITVNFEPDSKVNEEREVQ